MRLSTRAIAGGLALAASALLTACAGKVRLNPDGTYLGAGLYRSRLAAETDGPSYRLDLMSSGRFTLRTYAAGCLVGEETGRWSSDQESLELAIQETRGRDGCAGSWVASARQETFACPLRQVSGRSFQMLHDEIGLGAQWTEWSRDGRMEVADAADAAQPRALAKTAAPAMGQATAEAATATP